MMNEIVILALLIFLVAIFYSAIGQAGASGYLAAMALMGLSPTTMKPTALVLNILVASIACWKYCRLERAMWRLLLPLVLASVPFAFLGGTIHLPENIYHPVVGGILVYAACYSLVAASRSPANVDVATPSTVLVVIIGAAVGFVSGLTGVGGGIFLSPLLLWIRWAPINIISGISAAFILVNSVAALCGAINTTFDLPSGIEYLLIAALVGGYLGSEFGSKHLKSSTAQRLLALLLFVIGIKMLVFA